VYYPAAELVFMVIRLFLTIWQAARWN